ncbi:MAG TPA: hypothetical protein VM345_16985 [Acidimicrobiales bacterium]|jgi:hypothetical protein|nr:hypothetical protein [Acidimicrobiales bacterium]
MDDDRLDALLADAIAAEQARERVDERFLRRASEEEATFVGLLVALAEEGSTVAVRTAMGRLHRGRIDAVGRDVVVMRDAEGRRVLLATPAIASVRTEGASVRDADLPPARDVPRPLSFVALAAVLAEARPEVRVAIVGEDVLVGGTLRSVGRDLITVRRPPGSTDHVPVAAIVEMVLLDD